MDDGLILCETDKKCKSGALEFIQRALQFAERAHQGAYRKGSRIPYIVHPREAAVIVWMVLQETKGELCLDDMTIVAAAALHDVVEDAGVTLENLAQDFGEAVAALVAAESENKREGQPAAVTWKVRKEEAIEQLRHDSSAAKLIALGDKLSNMRAIAADHLVQGDTMWHKFNQSDVREHAWYYRSLWEVFEQSPWGASLACREYKSLVDAVFGKESDGRK